MMGICEGVAQTGRSQPGESQDPSEELPRRGAGSRAEAAHQSHADRHGDDLWRLVDATQSY